MRIGIKFCGGCQSKYDRRELYKQIKEKLPMYYFGYYIDEKDWDYVIIICGCHIKCAQVYDECEEKIIYIDSDKNALEKILKWIKS